MPSVRACSTSDVSPGSMKYVRASGKDLLIANVDGKFYAMNNWCTHEQGNLSEGDLKKNVVTCPDHGSQFDVTTGRVLIGPDGESADSIPQAKSYKTTVQGNDVMVDIL